MRINYVSFLKIISSIFVRLGLLSKSKYSIPKHKYIIMNSEAYIHNSRARNIQQKTEKSAEINSKNVFFSRGVHVSNLLLT